MNKPVFRVEGRNSSGLAPYATLEIRHQSPVVQFPNSQPTFVAAQDHLRQVLQNRRERLLADLASVDYNLQNFDKLFARPAHSLLDFLESQRVGLPLLFADMAANPRMERLGPIQMTNRYLDCPSGLWVFEVPEYGAVVETFSTEVTAILLQALHAAGLERVTDWNGVGYFSWSVRVRSIESATQPQAAAMA